MVQPVPSPAAFGRWLREHRERLYFPEAGRWVWRLRGHRAVSPRLHSEGGERDELVRLVADVTATRLKITKRIRKGWHAWSPKAVGQEPVTIAILPGSAFEIAGDVVWSDGEQLRVAITCTVCDETPCQPPRSVVLAR